ncbi:hypothetical protein [Pseudooceanicola nitratireducens]|jgi:DNA-binding NarL/FixJ family response regulator|uniref:hypothetical protein n=1 Tax=Pseudooceanicola nitratireducens TaxID=517719 RepID=UPI003C7E4604
MIDALASRNSQWQRRVKILLKDGFGVEDIALKTGCTFDTVRSEVAILRASGSLDAMFPRAE